jgi:hypothetical protein
MLANVERAMAITATLDRLTLNDAEEVFARIAPPALPRSSIVVSDEPLSEETNYRTEFVEVLSDQPWLDHAQAERGSRAHDNGGDCGKCWRPQSRMLLAGRGGVHPIGCARGRGLTPSASRKSRNTVSPESAVSTEWRRPKDRSVSST